MPQAQVIILNGVGSVGKTATARALQAIAARPFPHVAMDSFIDMLPARLLGHPDGLTFETTLDHSKPSTAVRSGPVLERAMRGMRQTVAAMAEQGNDLIVDEVMIGPGKAQEYRALLARFDVRFVGLFAPLEVLEAREQARGNREAGSARWQYHRVHRDIVYGLRIDTARTTPLESAKLICGTFGL